MLVGDTDSALKWADEAMAAAGPAPSVELRGAVLVNKGTSLLDSAGDEDTGVRLLHEGLAAAIEAEDHQSTLRALNNLAHYVLPLWEPPRSRALLEQMREIIKRTGRENWWDNWTELRAIFLAHVEGDLAGARAAVSLHESVRGRRWMALVDGELSYEAGELERAEELLCFARSSPRSGPAGATDRGFSLGLSARVAAQRGDVQATTDLISKLASTIEVLSKERRSNFSDTWHGALVAACRSGMSLDEVRALESLLATPLEPEGHQGDPGWPAHLRGAIAELEGDLECAIREYTVAATQTNWRRSVPANADAIMGLARSQLLAGDHVAAKKTAGQALTLLERWSGWRRDEAKALVRRLQAAGSPSRDGDLTAREREVAALVAEGLTNGEIGRRLFISTKTASVHVSSILRKLALSNRSEIAAWAVRAGIGGSPSQ